MIRDWHFDWLDVPALCEAADVVLKFPMVDQDPLPRWTLRPPDAARRCRAPDVSARRQRRRAVDPRLPRAHRLPAGASADPGAALQAYEAQRLPATAKVVLTNRANPPDAILREVYERTGDKPFDDIDRVISREELAALSQRYQKVAGYDLESVSR